MGPFYTHGAAVADYDRDGWPDLLVTGWGRVALFHNEPVDPNDPTKGRKFVEVKDAGLAGITWATSAAWGDLDGDGYPDLYVCQYVDWSWDNNPSCSYDGNAGRLPAQAVQRPAAQAVRQRAGKAQRFRDVSAEAGLSRAAPDASKGLGVLAVDVNGDGKPDIYVANDTADNFLYINRCTPGHFAVRGGRRPERHGPGRPRRRQRQHGLDAGDYDGCGRPSIWVTNYENELHALYHNDCKRRRDPVLPPHAVVGLGGLGRKYVGWGTGFLDLDHDGWEDIVHRQRPRIRYPTGRGSSRRQRPVLLRNQGDGKFKDSHRPGRPLLPEGPPGARRRPSATWTTTAASTWSSAT